MSATHDPGPDLENATLITTRAIDVAIGRSGPTVELEPGTGLRHVRSRGWWSGNIEYAEYFFEVEDGSVAGTEVCIRTAQVNGPPEDLSAIAARYGLEVAT